MSLDPTRRGGKNALRDARRATLGAGDARRRDARDDDAKPTREGAKGAMASDEREQQALQKRLLECLKRPENLTCAECAMRLPRWASTSLGVFFCTNCSGSHRGLGVHISKVKSTTLDKWTEAQVAYMERVGNAKANAYWEANVRAGVKPGATSGRDACERFIRDKYERQLFKDTTRDGPEESIRASASAPPEAAVPAAVPAQQSGGMFDLMSLHEPAPVQASEASTTFGGSEWTDFNVAPAPTAQVQAAPAPAPAPNAGVMDQWSDFTTSTAVQAQDSVADDGWGDFAAAPPAIAAPVAVEPAQAPKREMSKNDIMNLFDTPAVPAATAPRASAPIATNIAMGGLDQLQAGMMPQGGQGMMGGYGLQAPQQQQYAMQPVQQQQYMGGAQQYGYPPQHHYPQMSVGMMPQMGGMMPQMGGMMPQMGGMMPQLGSAASYGAQPYTQAQPQAPQSPPKPDTQNIPEFKW